MNIIVELYLFLLISSWLHNLWLLLTTILLLKGSVYSLMDSGYNYNDVNQVKVNTHSKSELKNFSISKSQNLTCKAHTIPVLISR